MHLPYPHPLLRHKHQLDKSEIVTLLFGGVLLWGIAFVCLFLPSRTALRAPGILWSVMGCVSNDVVALVAIILLGLMTAATLIAQVRDSEVPGWVFFLPALFVFVLL